MKSENVVIIGASDSPEKYSYKAMKMLIEYGHKIFLVHPLLTQIEGHKVYKDLGQITEKIDTITMYVNPNISSALGRELIKLKPGRVIFNPGSENKELQDSLERSGILTEAACTLVLLTRGQY